MTPERAEQIVGKLRQYRDIGVAMDIPVMYAEMVAEQGWREIGYDTWDALCVDRLGGWRLALLREERQQAAAEMAGKGMSTRAIGSALGVDHATVARDVAGVADATPALVTGLDGKTYPPRPPKAEDAAPRPSAIEAIVEADPGVRAARLRHRFTKELLLPLHGLHLFDPVEMAEIAPDRLGDLEGRIVALTAFRNAYAKALKPNLHILKES